MYSRDSVDFIIYPTNLLLWLSIVLLWFFLLVTITELATTFRYSVHNPAEYIHSKKHFWCNISYWYQVQSLLETAVNKFKTVKVIYSPGIPKCCRGGTWTWRWSSFRGPAGPHAECPAGRRCSGRGAGGSSTWVVSAVPPGPRNAPVRTHFGARCRSAMVKNKGAYLQLNQGLLYHRTCKRDFLYSWPSLNSYLK